MKRYLNVVFLIVGVAAILEFIFIAGMFTGPMMMTIVFVIGIANMIAELKAGDREKALLYLIATAGICMSYLRLMW